MILIPADTRTPARIARNAAEVRFAELVELGRAGAAGDPTFERHLTAAREQLHAAQIIDYNTTAGAGR